LSGSRAESKTTLPTKGLISCRDLSLSEVSEIFGLAERLVRGEVRLSSSLLGKKVALVFAEPSTRTFQSFYLAAKTLGAEAVSIADPTVSSMAKGESLYDTLKMLELYGASCIVLRHPARGAARFASESVSIPVINAGSGSQEHPTQALIDVFTIRRKRGRVDGLKIGLLGDLRYSRTIPSLCHLLSLYSGVEIYFMAPQILQVRREVEMYLEERGVQFAKIDNSEEMRRVMPVLDVLYVTRIQKERFPDPTEYEKVRGYYVVDSTTLSYLRDDVGIMHPLPRVDELSPEIDHAPNAWYFEQAGNGLSIRIALLHLILGGE
jgi:aspartate carbamoyltransferase catalytic subunit